MINVIKEHIGFKSQLFQLAKADLIKTYRGAALGWVWALIKPLTLIFVFWFVLKIGLRADLPVESVKFFPWLILGLLPWFYISDMLYKGTASIKKYKYLVTKMRFPVSTVPTFVGLSNLIVHLTMVALVLLLLFLSDVEPTIYYLQFPLYLLLLFVFLVAWSLFAAPLAAISSDFLNLIKALVRVLFWMSGILYSIDLISTPWLKTILRINPVTFFVDGYRNTFLLNKWFFEDLQSLTIFLITLLVLMVMAVKTYSRLRKEMVDVL